MTTPSKTVQAAQQLLAEREVVGLAKYGTTVDRADLTKEQWLQHLIEELADGLLYALRARDELIAEREAFVFGVDTGKGDDFSTGFVVGNQSSPAAYQPIARPWKQSAADLEIAQEIQDELDRIPVYQAAQPSPAEDPERAASRRAAWAKAATFSTATARSTRPSSSGRTGVSRRSSAASSSSLRAGTLRSSATTPSC